MARTVTFDPGKENREFIDAQVEAGRYNSASEVIREGLRLLQEKEADSKLNELRKLVKEGIDSPDMDNWSPAEFLARIEKNASGKKI